VKNEGENRPVRQPSEPGLAAKVRPMTDKEDKKTDKKTIKQDKPSSAKPIIR